MVISMDRNKFVWNTSFPSLTVCPHSRIDEDKMDKYMEFVSFVVQLRKIYCKMENTSPPILIPC